MAEVVDRIVAELIAKADQYVANFDRASQAHERFTKSVPKTGFDIAAEGAKYKQGAQQIAQAEQQASEQVSRARKKRAAATMAADKAEAASAKATADTRVREAERAAAGEIAAARKAHAASRIGPPTARDYFRQRLSSLDSGAADYQAQLDRLQTEAARFLPSSVRPVSTSTLPPVRGKAADVLGSGERLTDETKINAALRDQSLLTALIATSEGKLQQGLKDRLADLRLENQLRRAGVAEQQIAVELENIQTMRAARRAEAEAVAARRTGTRNAEQFARGAGFYAALGGAPALAGIATAAGVAVITAATKAGLDYAQTLKQDSEQLGLTTRDFQLYQRAAQEAGVTTEQFKSAFSALASNIGKAQAGDKQLSRVFGKDGLNIDLGNARDGFKSLSDILPTYLDRLSKIPDQTKRLALETASGSEEIRKLDPVLSQGAAAFDQWSRGVEKAGGILSDSEIQRSAETARKIALLNAELQKDLASTVSQNAGAIEQLAKAFFNLADGALKAFGYLRQIDNLDVVNGGLSSRARQGITGTSQSDDRRRAYKELLETSQGRQALLSRNSQTLSALDAADRGRGLDFNAPDLGGVADNPQARFAARQQALAARATILRVQKAYDDAAKRPETPVQPGKPGSGNVFSPAPPKGKSAETLENERITRDRRFADEMAQLQEQALQAQESFTGDIKKQAAIEDDLADRALKRRISDINFERDRNVNQGENAKEADARAAALRQEARRAAAQEKAFRDQETQARLEQATLDHAQTDLTIQAELLNDRLTLARTTKERLAVELELLRNAEQQRRNDLNKELAGLKPGDPRVDDINKQLAALPGETASKEAAARKQNQGPLGEYLDSLPRTAAEVDEAFQRAAVHGMQAANDQLESMIGKFLHLHGAAGVFLEDIIKIGIQWAEAQLFGGRDTSGFGELGFGGSLGGGGGAGVFLSTVVKGIGSIFGGARADGGPVLPGRIYRVNERGEEFFSPNVPGTIIPTHAINGSASNVRAQSAAPQMTVLAPRHFDLSNAVIDRETLAAMNEENRAYARQVAAFSGQQAVGVAGRQAPGIIKRQQTLGG